MAATSVRLLTRNLEGLATDRAGWRQGDASNRKCCRQACQQALTTQVVGKAGSRNLLCRDKGDLHRKGWLQGEHVFGSEVEQPERQRRLALSSRSARKVGCRASAGVAPGEKKRIVVTGLGVVSCYGTDVNHFYDQLLAGKSGITHLENFDAAAYPTKIGGEIKRDDFETGDYINPKMARRMDNYIRYLMVAGKKSLEDAGLSTEVMESLDKARCGILIGSAMGGMQIFTDAIEALNTNFKRMNPFCIPFVCSNMGSAMLAMDLGFMGPNYSIATACATGNYCILSAANHIWNGEADLMLCGGSDAAILPIGLGGFVACKALSKRNDAPEKASRPWDTDRDGFVMGEGAGVLILEELEHAKRRGAKIYCEFLGGSFTSDAHHMTDPHPEGAGVEMCLQRALESSGVAAEDVNYVNAHATSTLAGDLQEYKALHRAFGSNADLKMNSTKSLIGHLLGAAGAVEAVATALETGWVHPNLNLENPEPLVDNNVLVGGQKEKLDIKVALSNSFGFGGHNSSILFGPYKA
ncbi:3-ketoacyl-ACP synthase [Klebsormidium nitens]|uniref:3-oxoacyl-[acyl-carrier-protein] synthase I, chloroplastic n=1 Tax=Klebsormidium nitens TaxID=105231 RepID=A0A1Y1I9S7_KLENI|nr:3-ketoacyl-ACP synthase [Klebsormidium nitens]|eukprot:GAQ87715.1 3-ketoacyl-ACP synthase [Klebsormidium nitens]